MGTIRGRFCAALLIISGLLSARNASPQGLSKFDRQRVEQMWQIVAGDVGKHYYDRDFHGVDWDAQIQNVSQRIENENSLGRAFTDIAAAFDTLNDSHTYFVPPERPVHSDFGWEFQMIGDRCFITRVRPGSDAANKGMKPGDEVLTIDGYTPTRDTLWKMDYAFRILQPQPVVRFQLRDPAGGQRQLDVMTTFRQLPHVQDLTGNGLWDFVRDAENRQHYMRARTAEAGDNLTIIKLPEFFFTETEVDDMMRKAARRPLLIIDLRGNPGGAVDTLKYLLGSVFDHEVKIADQVERDKTRPLTAKSMGKGGFDGKLVVLVDSKSASAAELFARIVQLEKRGDVMGDRSEGSVMESKEFSYKMGDNSVAFYGASITAADLVMSDGKSLEHTGVTPDEVVLPTASDLAAGRDPVLAQAAAALGVKLSPEAAGKLFPYEWPPDTLQ